MTYIIRLRGALASEWTAANPILSVREPGIETDTNKFKFGNGTTPWNDLPYVTDPDLLGLPDPAFIPDNKMLLTEGGEWTVVDVPDSGVPVPDPTGSPDGKIMTVLDDLWVIGDAPTAGVAVPDPSAEVDGRMMYTDGGEWVIADAPAGGVPYNFRGAWATQAVLATYSFADGVVPSASPFSQSQAQPFGDGSTRFQVVPISSSPALNRPSVVNALQLHQGNYQSGHYTMMSLSLAAVAAATGHTPTAVRAWVAKVEGSNGNQVVASERIGGSNIRTLAPASGWVQYTDAVTDTATFDWRLQGTGINNGCSVDLFVANVEILGAQDPYMTHDTVLYNRGLYQSLVDNNASVPGADGNWQLLLTIPDAPTGLAAARGEWNPLLTYVSGDMIIKNRAAYIAQASTTGSDDPETPTYTVQGSTTITSAIATYGQFSPRVQQPFTIPVAKTIRAVTVNYRSSAQAGTVTVRLKTSLSGNAYSPDAFTLGRASKPHTEVLTGDNEFVFDTAVQLVAGVQYWLEVTHSSNDMNGIGVAAAANATDSGLTTTPVYLNGTVDSTARRMGFSIRQPKWLRFTPEVPSYKGDWSAQIYGKSDEVTRAGVRYRATKITAASDDPMVSSWWAPGDELPLTALAAAWFQFYPRAGQQFQVTAPTLVYGLNVKMAASQGAGTVTASIKSAYDAGTVYASVTSTTLVAGDNFLQFAAPVLLLPGINYWYVLDHSAGDMKNVAVLAPSNIFYTGMTLTASVQYGAAGGSTQAGQNILFSLIQKVWNPLAKAAAATPNAQTGTTYTLVADDAGRFVTMSNASASTLTVPPNSSVPFPIGTEIEGTQLGAGQVTLTPGSGVTINATPGLKVAAQYGVFGLKKLGTDTWLAYGRLAT